MTQQVPNTPRQLPEAGPQRRGDAGYLTDYFQMLAGRFRTMGPPAAGQQAAAAEAAAIAQMDARQVSWSDVYRLEQAVLRASPLPELRRQAWSLRREFAEVAGPARYAAYLAANPPDATKATEEELRADLDQVLEEVQWLYTVLPVQDEVRSRLVRRTALMTLALLLFIALALGIQRWLTGERFQVQPVVVALMVGAVGGLVSTVRRIQTTRLDENVVVGLLEMSRSLWSIYLSPLLGGVFAILLLLLFKGRLLSGELFPEFWPPLGAGPAAAAPRPITFSEVLNSLHPVDGANYAKFVVWCFIAGFAEQLVPDALARVAKSSESSPAAQPPAA